MDFRVPLYLDLIIVKVHLEEGVVLITMEVLLQVVEVVVIMEEEKVLEEEQVYLMEEEAHVILIQHIVL